MRAANSAERSPAKTRWAWVSTKPGTTARALDVDPPVGRGRLPRGPHPGDAPVVDDDRGVGEGAERGVEGAELADPGHQLAHAHLL